MANEMIRQVEVVSSHFSYTEEYVLDKSTAWTNRKFEQVLKEKHETYASHANGITSGVYNGIRATVSEMFGGKDKIDINDLMVKDYEESLKKQKEMSKEDAQDSGGGKYKMSFIEKARAAQMKQG